ncbi:serine/threonine-protein kinase [Streptomyces sp. NPDC051976]|uniref:serine/threonine-protein kinase n=1 Tax=Streptomyces sp. NPDC051976 TaxID=3154947 RepID=UPI00342985D6
MRLIDGRFELLERLGGGGMGLVWRARDNALDREVALKEVRPPDPAVAEADPLGAQQMRERVLREARALARLQHPHVVIIHHIVDTPEHPYPWLVMELVGGGSLVDRLARGPLGVPEAARIGRGVLSALRAAHAAGIQHRDVKPGNVLLRTDGTPVLTDFGIAALHDATALTATGALIGSPEYMAPERIRGEEGNPSSDLWSLGMMLYVGLEGQHPLRRATTLATLAAVLDEPLPPPTRSGPLGPVLAAVLAKNPAARPDAEALDRALAAAEHAGEYGGDTPPPASAYAPPAETPSPASPYAPPAGLSTPRPSVSPYGAPAGHPGHPSGQHSGQHLGPNSGQHSQPSFGAPMYPMDRPPGAPAGWMPPAGSHPGHPGPHTGTSAPAARRRRAVVAALSASGVVLAGVLAWTLAPKGGSGDDGQNSGLGSGHTPTTSASAPTATTPGSLVPTDRTPSAAAAPTTNLLTPDGVRRTVAAIKPYTHDGKIKELVVYPGYASAEAPTPADQKLYDDIEYRDGQTTHSPGGTMESDDTTVSLSSYDWNVIPALLAKAQKTLNVPHPTSRYLIIGPDLFDGTPTIRVYLSDAYGSGYLSATTKGVVRDTFPRGS